MSGKKVLNKLLISTLIVMLVILALPIVPAYAAPPKIDLKKISVGAQSATLTYGTAGLVTFPVTVTCSGTGTGFTAAIHVTAGLPSGATANIPTVTFTSNCTNSPQTANLRITTTNAAPAGVSSITVSVTATGKTTRTGRGRLTIAQRRITVTANTGQSKIYGNPNPVLTYTSDPLVGSDTFSGALSRVAGENVGLYAITQGTLTAGSNYIITFVSNNFRILRRGITVTVDTLQAKVYGNADPALTYTSDPLVGSDIFSGILSRAPGENAGLYAITQGTLTAGNNYAITFVSKNFRIIPRTITVTANAGQSKVYGDADPVFTYNHDPLMGGDTLSGALSRVTGKNVGLYAITQGTLTASSNYTISFVSADFEIKPHGITVTADSGKTKVYGNADPVFTYTHDPLLVGDSISGALSRSSGEDVGPYAITQGTLTAGSNYTITFVSANFQITPKVLTVTADNQTITVGDPDPTFTYTVNGFVGTDDFITPPTCTGSVPHSDPGKYDILCSGGDAGANYTISYVNGILFVNAVINHPPTDISLSNSSVDENQPIGTTVGTLTTTDPDSGDVHTYSFTCSTPGADDSSFSIAVDVLQTAAIFDYETRNSYNICIRTGDDHGGTFDKNFTIAVNDLSEIKTATFRSIGTQDGWVLESGRTSNRGGAINSSAITLRVGDDAANRQYRSILSFATGAILPDNAVITKITLMVRRQGITGVANPVSLFQGFMVAIRRGSFGTPALQITDWQALAGKTIGPFIPRPINGWYSFNLTGLRLWLNKLASGNGLTQFRLSFKLGDNGNAVANILSLYSGNTGVNRPRLIVEYYVP